MTSALTQLLDIQHPIVLAPMAGEPSTPALAAAVSNAGGLGSLGAAYLTPAALERIIAETRALTACPFAVNLFAPFPEEAQAPRAFTGHAALDAIHTELGLPPQPSPTATKPAFEAQLAVVLATRPAALSFTFGQLSREHMSELRARKIVTIGTATTADEAALLEQGGVDIICAQGAEAGGHRGTFLGSFEDALIGTMALVPQIVSRVRVPVLAAGGIMNGQGIAAALALGASGAQLGTAFLDCPEAGTSAAHRAALRSEAARRTVITRAFSGRPARGIRNRFTDLLAPHGALPFSLHQAMTRALRAEANKRGRVDLMQLWAGQGAPLIRSMPAAQLVDQLMRETLAASREF